MFTERDVLVMPLVMSRARHESLLAHDRRQAGRAVEIRDVEIAGITAARRATLATGNIRHFEGLGLDVVDPWQAATDVA